MKNEKSGTLCGRCGLYQVVNTVYGSLNFETGTKDYEKNRLECQSCGEPHSAWIQTVGRGDATSENDEPIEGVGA